MPSVRSKYILRKKFFFRVFRVFCGSFAVTHRIPAIPIHRFNDCRIYSLANNADCWQIAPALKGDELIRNMHRKSPNEEAIVQKTVELCQVIVAQPQFSDVRRQIESFMADPKAQEQYRILSEKGQALHEKQHQGMPLDQAEITAFDSQREAFFANPIAAGFVSAQEQMHNVQETVSQYVAKTYELGRIPLTSDFETDGCCGGQHHHGDEPHEHGGEGCQCRH